jgi:hypothetical protein
MILNILKVRREQISLDDNILAKTRKMANRKMVNIEIKD